MPYIKKELRQGIDFCLEYLVEDIQKQMKDNNIEASGMLNYAITKLLLKFYTASYDNYAKAIGMLETCKLEFYRAQVGPYEMNKKFNNGDVENDL